MPALTPILDGRPGPGNHLSGREFPLSRRDRPGVWRHVARPLLAADGEMPRLEFSAEKRSGSARTEIPTPSSLGGRRAGIRDGAGGSRGETRSAPEPRAAGGGGSPDPSPDRSSRAPGDRRPAYGSGGTAGGADRRRREF